MAFFLQNIVNAYKYKGKIGQNLGTAWSILFVVRMDMYLLCSYLGSHMNTSFLWTESLTLIF